LKNLQISIWDLSSCSFFSKTPSM